MNVFMTGGTGFVGTTLTRKLVEKGHHVTVLTRRINENQEGQEGVSFLEGDPTQKGAWQEQITEHEVIINLAGASIFRRWSKKAKALIRDSRVLTTKNLVEALRARQGKKTTLISTSAVGYYGFHQDEILDESSAPGDDFLASLSEDWESSAMQAEKFGCRVVICRLGIVLGKNGGALGEMIPLFNKYLGSPIGNGEQWFSWIHEQDLAEIYSFILERKDLTGPMNCTAPEAVKNRDFTKALGEALGKPTFMPPIPEFVIKIVKGEFGRVLVKGQRAYPSKLSDAGFHFRFPEIDGALNGLVR